MQNMNLSGTWETDAVGEYRTIDMAITPGIGPQQDGLIGCYGEGSLTGPGLTIKIIGPIELEPAQMEIDRETLGPVGKIKGVFIGKLEGTDTLTGWLRITEGDEIQIRQEVTFKRRV